MINETTALAIAGSAVGVTFLNKISDAVGAHFEPRQIRRVAEAEGEAIVIRAQAESEVEIIRAQTDIKIANLRRRAETRFALEEVIHQANIESVIAKALPNLNSDASPEDMDNDWITNFFGKCRIVSDEQMQEAWVRILAGEANNPGSFSRKTVNLMADLGQDDARLFSTLCCFAWSDVDSDSKIPIMFDLGHEIYKQEGITSSNCFDLDDIGLVKMGTFGFGLIRNQTRLSYFTRGITVRTTDNSPGHGIIIGKTSFTRAGQELARICDVKPVDGFFEYVRDQLSQDYEVTLE